MSCYQVDLKMRYNDARRTKIGQQDILSGKEWYEIQAFRALNQVHIDYFMLQEPSGAARGWNRLAAPNIGESMQRFEIRRRDEFVFAYWKTNKSKKKIC